MAARLSIKKAAAHLRGGGASETSSYFVIVQVLGQYTW